MGWEGPSTETAGTLSRSRLPSCPTPLRAAHHGESKAAPGAGSEPEQLPPATPDPRFLTSQGCRFLPAELRVRTK